MKPILSVLAALVLLPLASRYAAAAPDGKPNILFILADDMGFSDAGCYGGEIQTPHLDSLAKGGLRFTQFYNTPACWPSRAVILTGYYAQQVRRDAMPGVPRSGGAGGGPGGRRCCPCCSDRWAIARTIPASGISTVNLLENGFDRAYTLDDHNRFFYPRQHAEDDQPLPPVAKGAGYYATTAIANHAIKCLREHAARHADQPFFHYLCFNSPHFPLQALQEDIVRYRQRYREGWDAVRKERGRRLRELGIVNHDPPAMERDLGPPYDFPKDREKLGPGEVFGRCRGRS